MPSCSSSHRFHFHLIGKRFLTWQDVFPLQIGIHHSCLILSGTLWTHLADINEQAHEQIEYLVEQLKIGEGLTEKRKADNPLEWTRRMNNLRSRAEEIIKVELIFA